MSNFTKKLKRLNIFLKFLEKRLANDGVIKYADISKTTVKENLH